MTIDELKHKIQSMGYTIDDERREDSHNFGVLSTDLDEWKWNVMSVYAYAEDEPAHVWIYKGPKFRSDVGFSYAGGEPCDYSLDEIISHLEKCKIEEKECIKKIRIRKIEEL